MKRNRPDLIVPIKDRRQSRRYLTLHNAAISFAVLVMLFLGISIRSEMEPRGTESAFGRLLDREMPQVEPKPLEVVTEAGGTPVDDQQSADPMLVAPAAREQWLRDSSNTASAASIEPIPAPSITVGRRTGADSKIAIVGGPEGVAVVEQKKKQPLLTGGFGRQ